MIVTTAVIERGKSRNGGWSRLQLECLGVSFPLKSGWRRRLIGSEVPAEMVERFLALKDGHLKDGPVSLPGREKSDTGSLTADAPQGMVVRPRNTTREKERAMSANLIDNLLNELDGIARETDRYEYGLPSDSDALRAAVLRFREAVIKEERRARDMLWSASLPGAGVYWMRSPWTGIVKVRLVLGGFNGETPLVFAEDGVEITIPGGAEWAVVTE